MESPTSQPDKFSREYAAALKRYLRRGGEAALVRAYDLGRRALGDRRGVLSMVALHQEAMAELLRAHDKKETIRPEAVLRAGTFLTESMSSFEMAHRTYFETNAALHRMNDALEGQVKQIAQEIHDGAGQLLAAVYISLDMIEGELSPLARARLQDVKKHLDDAYQQLRHLSHELRPTILDDLGLVRAIQFLSEGVAQRAKLQIAVRASDGVRIAAPIESALYRVVQEALNNICIHAKAKSVNIRLRSSDTMVRCSVVDDGVGFVPGDPHTHPSGRGLGLLGMREKLRPLGGVLKIESAPGQGTKLFITVPRRG
jgi:signal transduction histidine kinase